MFCNPFGNASLTATIFPGLNSHRYKRMVRRNEVFIRSVDDFGSNIERAELVFRDVSICIIRESASFFEIFFVSERPRGA